MSDQMTDAAATTNEGAATSPAASTSSETTSAPVAQSSASPAPQNASPGEVDKSAETAKADEAPKDVKTEGAPESYAEFTIPTEVDWDESGKTAFADFAKSQNLSQEAAQSLINAMAPAMQQRQADAIAQVQTMWADQSKTDKEFGGAQLKDNLVIANKALDQFGTPELVSLLKETGLANHPEMVRAFYRAGKAISEDKFVKGTMTSPQSNRDYASHLYPNQKH
jgi:hypothetical protein